MAKRTPHEINAGSMADIAFLLLIFFLVTTTMEVDAGISRQLPLKRPDRENETVVHERDILQIKANANNELMVEGKDVTIEGLEQIVVDFYTVNIKRERDKNMPSYNEITAASCMSKIHEFEKLAEKYPTDLAYEEQLEQWKTKLDLCQTLGGAYPELNPMAAIRIEVHAGSTYGLYMDVQNILRRVVNQLRADNCKKYFGRDYFTLDENAEADQEIIRNLRVLVPERIIDAKISR